MDAPSSSYVPQNVWSAECIVIEYIDFPDLIIEPRFSLLCNSNNPEKCSGINLASPNHIS